VFIQETIHLVDDLDEALGISFSLGHFLQVTPSFGFVS
jgi:hypothetical protein